MLNTLPLYQLLGSESANALPSLPIAVPRTPSRPSSSDKNDFSLASAAIFPPLLPSTPSSSPTSSPVNMPLHVVSPAVVDQLLEMVARQRPPEETTPLSGQQLHLLLLATLESVMRTHVSPQVVTQVSSTLHLLHELTLLFEDIISLWLQLHNESSRVEHLSSLSISADSSEDSGSNRGPPFCKSAYQGVVQVARTTLRLWLSLTSQVFYGSLTSQQVTELKPLLFSPMVTISKACYNLKQVGVFRGDECLDHEFTLMILETLLSSLHSANLLAPVVVCPIEDVFVVFRECLSDGCQEWFTYLCSKLHFVLESRLMDAEGSNWSQVMDCCNCLLVSILKELICMADHIKEFQKASKLALSGEVLLRPVTYSLELSTGLDKLIKKMSKMANVVLECFKQESMIQLLSLQLLSETAGDTVQVISSFLGSILDPVISSNSDVLDHFLELLESVWFSLSAEFQGSSSWWKKLSCYFTLIHTASRATAHQVLYHLQCLFSHDSVVLKSQLTHHIILPLHAHLIAMVREKVYSNVSPTPKPEGRIAPPDSTDLSASLEDDEKALIVLFLKLLLKVVSHPSSRSSI